MNTRESLEGQTGLEPEGGLRKSHAAFTTIGLLLVAAHLVAMYLWIAPSNAMSRAAQPALSQYALPTWQQQWSLFAPVPVHAGYYLEARAAKQSTDSTREWSDASEHELAGLRGNLLPTTAINITNKLATGTFESLDVLGLDERELFSANYAELPWEKLAQQLVADGSASAARNETALLWDRAATAYVTQFLRATDQAGPDDLVQYQLVKVSAAPFGSRLVEKPKRSVVFTSGLRPQTVIVGQDEEAFKKALESFK